MINQDWYRIAYETTATTAPPLYRWGEPTYINRNFMCGVAGCPICRN